MSEEKEKPQEDRTPGIFSWNELMTSDAEGGAQFYESLFGWSREVMPMPNGEYHFFKIGDRPAAGMVQFDEQMGQVPPHWGGYVTVESLEESLAKASELGGTVLVEATDLPMGRFAVLQDPQGATISLWQFKDDVDCGEADSD